MSEKKRARRRKDEYTGPGEQQVDKPSKNEIQVAKWMKKNVKTKKTKFLSHNVEYFTSNKAVDALMKSKFALSDSPLFPTRDHAIEFLDLMLDHKFFHRAKKVPVSIDELRGGSSKSSKLKDDKSASKNRDKDKLKDNKEENRKDTEAEADQSATNGGDDASGSYSSSAGDKKEQKRKRKIRLDMHPEQIFVDGSEAYVWIFDPIPIHYWIYGLILLLGAIGICLFPLWPSSLRKGVYYLTLAAAGFLVFILALTVVRLIVFSIMWAITGGRLLFWIFPNLTEDVGFFASFWPLYESNYCTDGAGKTKSEKKSKSKSQKKKEKDSDAEEEAAAEEEDDVTPLEPEKIEQIKEHDADNVPRHRRTKSAQIIDAPTSAKLEEESNSSEAAAESDTKGSGSPSESESEISGRDYEIISSSEIQNVR